MSLAFFQALLSAGVVESFTVSNISVKYNDTDATYLTNKAGLQSGTNFAANSNVLGVTTIVADNTANASLTYDQENDQLIVLNLNASGNIGSRFFDKATVKTAMAAAIGTIPAAVKTIVGDINAIHGQAFDPINQVLYLWLQGGSIVEYNSAGTLIATRSQDTGYSTPGSIAYNYKTGDMWFARGGVGGFTVKRLRLVAGSWVTQETSWFTNSKEMAVDPFLPDGLILRAADSSANQFYRPQEEGGGRPQLMPYPFSTANFINNTQNCVRDARNGTFWFNVDTQYHDAAAPNENTLYWVDPLKLYRKYLRFPDMHRYSSLFHLTSTLTGKYNAEILTGSGWDTGPVIDYAAFTGQQTIGNWVVKNNNADLEWRGSSTPPSTTPISDTDETTIKLYTAINGGADNYGWGSTTPSDWQSTPTTHRYMQHRQKSKEAVERWTPAALGSKVKFWIEMHKTGLDANPGLGMYYSPITNRVSLVVNSVNGAISPFTATVSQQPTFSVANSELQMLAAGPQGYTLVAGATSMLNALGDVDVHCIFRRNATNQMCIPLAIGNTASANSSLSFRHNGSSNSPFSHVNIRYVDGAGVVNTMGFVDTSITHKLRTFRLGNGSNQILTNGVAETLIVTGSNTGQTFTDVSSPNSSSIGRDRAGGTLNGNQHGRFLLITDTLTDDEMASLIQYCTEEGMI